MNRQAALSRIKIAAAQYGTQRNAAEAWGIKPSYLNEVLRDKRGTVSLPEHILQRVGLEAEVLTKVVYKEIA